MSQTHEPELPTTKAELDQYVESQQEELFSQVQILHALEFPIVRTDEETDIIVFTNNILVEFAEDPRLTTQGARGRAGQYRLDMRENGRSRSSSRRRISRFWRKRRQEPGTSTTPTITRSASAKRANSPGYRWRETGRP